MTGTAGRHAPTRRHAAPSRALRRLGLALAAASGAVVLAVVASGGTYALLNSSATVPGAVVRSGTATLAVTTALSLPTTVLYPGISISGSAIVQNTGNVPLSLRIAGLSRTSSATDFASSLTVGVSTVATSASCPAVSTAWTGTFASATPTDLSVRLAQNGSVRVCVSVSLPVGAPATANANAATTFILSLDGRQVA
ncbi:hypothetical protein N1031_11495 [Herbiconiux moechotypicola]|uniref:Uncharacterized protein n=1 Tax=Herbiconiux moechotypicola TaxID=637393 RepID=A0ABP5QJ36_9MICO|nr:hypothetical protein [Herbiconiux moechotypicola]MCS5730386.1 hypothetical protein [Herbiconiux moechotypicola]